MGNLSQKQKENLFRKKPYPYKVSLVELNFKVQTEGIKFQQSPYNIEPQRFVVIPHFDKNIRNSEFCYVPVPLLSQKSSELIANYFLDLNNFNKEYDQINTTWRMTRYHENGHFVEHSDREKQMEGHRHFGTEIFIPPFSETKFQGGQLTIKYLNEQKDIVPHETLWTHIILPLGIDHQVQKVTSGTRISYVKQIWVLDEDEDIQTDQDREIRERANNRMMFVD